MSYVEPFDLHGGLLLHADAPKRPELACEYALKREKNATSYVLRLAIAGEARMWFRIDDWWSAVTMARADGEVAIVDPIRAATVRETKDWLRYFADALIRSPRTPLHQGTFWLTPLVETKRHKRLPPYVKPLTDVGRTFARGREVWEPKHYGAIWPLRSASNNDSGRVKMWRKHARAGTLPPILLLLVSPIEGYILLDGHDRLLAALLEHKRPGAIALAHLSDDARNAGHLSWQRALEEQLAKARTERFSQQTIERFNLQLIMAHGADRYEARTRCYPMRGGLAGFRAEVKRAVSHPDIASDLAGIARRRR
ncbi:MAG: hypothetical protein IT381_12385 [Deltaproteobacteria bacterium]|nr:hypothetical protein [Deltaproteobacteria bacterium]